MSKIRTPLSLRHPLLYYLRVHQKRLFRRFCWLFSSRRYAKMDVSNSLLAYRHTKHSSKLIRTLGESDIQWQYNKVVNLKIATKCINGVFIPPKMYFSFCYLVGKPTKKRGFLKGMELSFGEARTGIGGGICQLSNLIHWMAIHTPLQVIERASHSFDPFPDQGRVLPFGSGAAIFYNYIDLILYNPTEQTFQINLNVCEDQLEGEIRSTIEREHHYHIHEKNHQFVKAQGAILRENEIWQDITTKGHNPKLVQSRCLYKNRVRVKYTLSEDKIDRFE